MKATNQRVLEHLRIMTTEGRRITTGTVARHARVSDTTAYTTLLALVGEGKLEHVGAGRGAHFRPVQPALARIVEAREGLREDEVWQRLAELPAVKALKPNVRDITRHALTEMVNNAIDHSGGASVSVTLFREAGAIGFEVLDDGVGIFENVMEKFALKSPFEAIGELQKGKITSMPLQHSGEGLFFTSKMGDRMTVESHATRWIIDNTQPDDMAVVRADPQTNGTRVRFEIALSSDRTTVGAFAPFTDDDHAWTKTRTVIHLFREGNQIVSRSEAKRLLVGLEKWREVELDFKGIEGIGQGFADEVFRVWSRAHPDIRLVTTNMNEAVAFMIERARAAASESGSSSVLPQVGSTAPTVNVSVGGSTTTTST